MSVRAGGIPNLTVVLDLQGYYLNGKKFCSAPVNQGMSLFLFNATAIASY